MTRALLLLGLAASTAGCANSPYLQYDHGRSYLETQQAMADLTRPSVAESDYMMVGAEAAEIRLRQVESTTDAESGEAEATAE